MTTAILPKLRSKGTVLTAGSANTVYTCPANHTSKMVLLFVSNHTNSNKTVSIKWYDSSAAQEYTIVGGYAVSGYSFLKFDQSYLILNAGDYMTVTPEAGSTMDATVTVEEFFDPSNRE